MVGSIHFDVEDQKQEPKHVTKFSPHGYFAFGGSTVILLFKPGTVVWDQDLLANANKKLETLVQVGDQLGIKS